MLLVCAFLFVAELSPFMLAGNWAAIGQVAAPFLAAIVFVVLFTQLAVNEQRARAKVEQLAAELSEANAKLRDYALRVEELAAAEERNRLAREIHDTLGHYLTAINVQLEAARAILEADRDRALDALHKAQMLAKEGLADVRRSVAALRATPTESRPLREAVQALAEECRAAGIRTEVVVQGDVRPLKPQAELTLYRAAQEGLTNVRRHAQASQVRLTLDYTSADTVRLNVEDNGVGAAEGAASGFGLLGIRERAQILGGQVRVHSRPGQGFTLEVEVPG
jgi:signal transduction histidine kinase